MPKASSKLPFPTMARICQHNDFYCGPAVMAMLYDYQGIEIEQDHIVRAAGVGHKIKAMGITIEELGIAVENINSELGLSLQFWFKRFSTLSDLSRLIHGYSTPVGVEWQGIFNEEEAADEAGDEGDSDDDPGHYSILTDIDTHHNLILLADPYHNKGKDSRLTVLEFDRRWWDINSIVDAGTGKVQEVDDYHTLFIVVPQYVTFPKELHMERLS